MKYDKNLVYAEVRKAGSFDPDTGEERVSSFVHTTTPEMFNDWLGVHRGLGYRLVKILSIAEGWSLKETKNGERLVKAPQAAKKSAPSRRAKREDTNE